MGVAEVETRKHIQHVSAYLSLCASELLKRGIEHDASKLREPEASIFDEYTPRLKGLTYGSVEYYACMKEMQTAINHHQLNNRHHPEFYCSDDNISEMNLFDLMEMIVDWLAATKRHADGDIYRSIEHNKTRFKISKQVEALLSNTVHYITQKEKKNDPPSTSSTV